MALKKEQGNVYMTALYASIILAGAYVVGKALKKYKQVLKDSSEYTQYKEES